MDSVVKLFRQFLGLPKAMVTAMVGQPTPSPGHVSGSRPTASPAPPAPEQHSHGVSTGADCGTQFLVRFEVFHTIIDAERLQQAITATHDQLNHIFASGTVIASGAYAGKRGGFVLLEVQSGEELLGLLAPGLSDNCTLDIEPALPFEKQGEALAKFGFQVPH